MKRLALFFALAVLPLGAITRVGSAVQGNTGVVASAAISYTATTGNTLFFLCTKYDGTSSNYTATASDGTNTYIQDLNEQTQQSGPLPGQSQFFLFRATNITGGALTITCTLGATQTGFLNLIVVEYSGLKNSSQPEAGTNQANHGPDAPNTNHLIFTSPSISPTSNDLLVGVWATNDLNPNSFTTSGGFSIVRQTNATSGFLSSGFAEQIISSAGSYSMTVNDFIPGTPSGTGWAAGIAGYLNSTPPATGSKNLPLLGVGE